jgi:hypothetical protein
LHEGESEIEWIDQVQGIARQINKFAFYPARVRDLVIFRLPMDLFGVYVTDSFATCVHNEGLQGFVLKEVWEG